MNLKYIALLISSYVCVLCDDIIGNLVLLNEPNTFRNYILITLCKSRTSFSFACSKENRINQLVHLFNLIKCV